jgi:hypothetical protein
MSEALTRFNRAVAISYGGGDQTLAHPGTGLYISTAGNLVVRLRCGVADTTLTGLLVGTVYDFEVVAIRQTGSTAAGLVLYSN